MTDLDNWQHTCAHLRKMISTDAFERWFTPVRFLHCSDNRITLGIDNAIYQYWIEEHYLSVLKECIQLAWGKDADIGFEIQHNGTALGGTAAPEGAPSAKNSTTNVRRPAAADLKPNYTFQTFVVGLNNQFAHAASQAVAKSPAKTYNPLFIHGAVGLGKTHLMHAIGHEILKLRKGARIVYVTSEQFTNEFVSAIQHGEINKFRKRFRFADVLLIDDVQFFAGKDRSQEEFFHTFNALFDGNKQIVLTCDSPPSDVQNLEQRLVSRFEWGLTAELQPPDIETRLAILRAKAAKHEVVLGDEVLLFIAERVKANIRRLEGALNRVAMYATLNRHRISRESVEELLKDFIQEEAKHIVTIEQIQRKVAEDFDLRLADMTSKKRPNNIAMPRMVAMYLSRVLTGKSLQEIGESFGGRDHGTVLHAYRKIEDRMTADAALRQQILRIKHRVETEA